MTGGATQANAGRIAGRVAGFVAHLRLNDFAVGPAETAAAIDSLGHVDPVDPRNVRLGLKTLLASRPDEWDRFDDLFEAYWHARGRTRHEASASGATVLTTRPRLWRDHLPLPEDGKGSGPLAKRDTEGSDEVDGSGRIVASRREALMQTDLRHIVDRDEMAEAEKLAADLARAMRYRLSRRYRIASKGPGLDLRRTTRRNLSHGGEPIELVRRKRPDRPVRIVVLLDVSGSMKSYSRFFLQFVKGLVCSWVEADAYLFHTRLVRVTDTMRDKDPIKAMTRLALMAQGFGGGTRIGECLREFNDRYAKRALNSRTVVIILSDGYDTGEATDIGRELKRLHRKARRIVWLNPLLGWRTYEPVTRAMQAALPHIDCFAAAHSLEALAAIEPDLAKM